MSNLGRSYFLGINGVQSGPFLAEELLSRISSGELSGVELCWSEGRKDWQPLTQVFPGMFTRSVSVASPAPALPIPGAHPRVSSRVWIDGKTLVVPRNAAFPPICIRTGATEDLVASPLRIRLSWHHPAVFIALLASFLVYLVLALVLRKNSTHTVYLSRAARASHVKWHLANWGIFLGSFVLGGVAIQFESSALGLLTFAAFIACIVIYFVKVRLLHASKIDSDDAHVGGIPPAVMARFVAAWK